MRPQPRMRALIAGLFSLATVGAALAPTPAVAQPTSAASAATTYTAVLAADIAAGASATIVAETDPAATDAAAATSSILALPAAEDATISSFSPKENFGATETLRVTYTPPSDTAAAVTEGALLSFDLGVLPRGSQVLAATLRLHQISGPTEPVTQTIYAGNSSWNEGSVTWNNGPGRPAGPPPLNSQPPAGAGVAVELNVTPFVQAWVNGPPNLPNKGFVLLPVPEAGAPRVW